MKVRLMTEYLWNVGEGVSQLFNATLGGNPNMTFSARCYVNKDKPKWKVAHKVVNTLFFFQKDHCKKSWESDIRFANKALTDLHSIT